jgi:hypothetical protein
MTVFLNALDAGDKAVALHAAIHHPAKRTTFDVDVASFAALPGSPFAYWSPRSLLQVAMLGGHFEPTRGSVRVGVQTDDDSRFVRLWWESRVARAQGVPRAYWPFLKGGSASAFYDQIPASLNWRDDGSELKAFVTEVLGGGHWSRHIFNLEFYGRRGMSWALRTARFAPSCVPSGCIPSVSRYLGVTDARDELLFLALWNSRVVDAFCKLSLERRGHPKFIVGVVKTIPVPDLTPADEVVLAALARRAWSLKRSLDTRTETSHAFVLPALFQVDGGTLAARSAAWTEHVREVEAELAAIQGEIDERCFVLYGIDDEDRRSITEGFGGSPTGSETSEDDAEGDADAEDEAEADAAADTATLVAELVSWAVGVAFGRFDVRLATGERALPVEPEPFDPLPVCSAAMLTGDDGLPLVRPPAGYPLAFPDDGILVDDPGHPRDLTTAVRAVFATVFGASADALWQEAAALLDPKGHELRTWLASGFFEHHLKRHSKSRRKAPIVWQLGVPSARYSTWPYAHRLTRDSLFALARDVVAPKLALEERRRTDLVRDAGPNPTAKQRAEIATQDADVEELRVFGEEVRRVAPLWNPDLDDGSILVLAPLWRLVPNHRAWQKELKGRWDELVAGKYDWAHLALHLWPERVVPKCVTDRSLAIAHGLEDVFWVEGADGKWSRRTTPTRPIDDLVADRTSPAVRAALAGVLEASGSAAGGRRGKRDGE